MPSCLRALVAATAATAASSSHPSLPATPSGACVLYIPASLTGFGFGSLSSAGDVTPLWSTADGWAAILGGAFSGRGPAAFVTQPTLSDGSLPLATLRLLPGGASASIDYTALAPAPGHEALGAPAVLGLVDATGSSDGSELAVLSSADGAFSYYAIASLNCSGAVNGSQPVPVRILRDVTADLEALGSALLFGLNAHDPAADVLYLATSTGNQTIYPQSVIAAFSLSDAARPVVPLPLPQNVSAISLQWSRIVAATGRPGLVVLAQDNTPSGSLQWLALDSNSSSAAAGQTTWTTLFRWPAASVAAPEIGVGGISADGATLMALLLDAGDRLTTSFVDVASGAERTRIGFRDRGLIGVDVVECRPVPDVEQRQ